MEKEIKVLRSFDWNGILFLADTDATLTASDDEFIALIQAGLFTVVEPVAPEKDGNSFN